MTFILKPVTFKLKVIAETKIEARDGFPLASTIYKGDKRFIIMASATAVPRRFYRHMAKYLQGWGATVVCFDYRGVGESRPKSLRGFEAKFSQWGLLDLAGVIQWCRDQGAEKVYIVGHSAGGQVAALTGHQVDAMVTLSSQSGYWKLQGGWEKLAVWFHVHVTFRLLTFLFGYMPWSKVGSAEDIPTGVALEWSSWCRHPDYIFGDKSLPLELYQDFTAPILAYSIDDDDWGTAASVDSMMGRYPKVERRHLTEDRKIGHFGYFRPHCEDLWGDVTEFLGRY